MAKDSSAGTRQQSPHVTKQTPRTTEQTPDVNHTTRTATIIDALKRRAQAILNDESLDAGSRAIIWHNLETNEPWLAELVPRAEPAESVADTFDSSQTGETGETDETDESDSIPAHGGNSSGGGNSSDGEDLSKAEDSRENIEELAQLICHGADESAAALLVLMGQFENAADPRVLAHTVKHYAFTRCGELNLFGIVDAQIAALQRELCMR
jgi:hypothetical protein